MKPINSVKKDRVNRMYVERKTVVNRIATVDPVDPIKPVHNESSHINENFLLLAGAFYDSFSQLRGQFKKFYLRQQELEKLLRRLPDEGDESESILRLMEELVERYNCALQSLKQLEHMLTNETQSQELYQVLSDYQLQLEGIGITLLPDQSLSFNASIFKNNHSITPDSLSFLFDYQQGLVKKLYHLFKHIKATTLKLLPTYGEDSVQQMAGMLLDQKY